MAKDKVRLDELLVQRRLVSSKNQAQALILSGAVVVNDELADKAGLKLSPSVNLRIKDKSRRFVSRGGEKLESAIIHFKPELESCVALDVGCSTGGFTHCLLEHGAAIVYATDVGRYQLADRLRNDERVIYKESLHARDLTREMFDPAPTFAVVDLSFISVRKVIDSILSVLASPKEMLILVKPQFELEPQDIEKGGVVRSKENQLRAIELVRQRIEELGACSSEAYACPVLGAKKGNQEFFLYVQGR